MIPAGTLSDKSIMEYKKSHPPALLPPAACSTSHHIPCASFVFEPMEPISLRIKNKKQSAYILPSSFFFLFIFLLLVESHEKAYAAALVDHPQLHWSSISRFVGSGASEIDSSWEVVGAPETDRLPAVDRQVARWAKLLRGARRLAFRRRCWGLQGGWLQQVQRRGEQAIEDL